MKLWYGWDLCAVIHSYVSSYVEGLSLIVSQVWWKPQGWTSLHMEARQAVRITGICKHRQWEKVARANLVQDLFHLVQPCWLCLLPSFDVLPTVRYSLVTTEHLLKFCGILKLNLSHRPISVERLYILHYLHDIRQKHHPRLLYLWISEWKFMCWKPDPQIHTLIVYRHQALEVVGTVAGPHEYPSYVSKSLCKS
jgi:hypothetical protein